MVFTMAYLMISHWAVLPRPDTDDARWASQLQDCCTSSGNNWTMVHFLYDNCACSRRVLAHVTSREPVNNVREQIVLVAETPPEHATFSGHIPVEYVTPVQLKERFGVESAPLLVVIDDQKNVRYTGGYTSRKQGPEIKDFEIVSDLMAGDSVAELPLFGCAVSKELQKLIDPLGLKN